MTRLSDSLLDKAERIYTAAEDNIFPRAVQPMAEAIAVDFYAAGYGHMSRAAVDQNIDLYMTVGGLLEKLKIIEDHVRADAGFQPSPTDMDHLTEWFTRLRRQIPENLKNLCFMESQAVELPQQQPKSGYEVLGLRL